MYLKCFNDNYSFRFKIPSDIRIYFYNRYELIISLKTKNAKLAKLKALKLGADLKTLIEKIRLIKSMKIENVDEIVQNWLNEKLARDLNARIIKSSLRGFREDELPREKQADYSNTILSQLETDMKRLSLRRMRYIAEDLIKESIDTEEPTHKELMFKLLQANVALFTELKNRNEGRFIFGSLNKNDTYAPQRVRLTYKEAVTKYMELQTYRKESKSQLTNLASFMNYTFLTIFGPDELVADSIEDVMEELDDFELLPLRASEKILKGKMTKEVLLQLNGKKIEAKTHQNYINWSKGFFKWAYNQGYTTTNIAESFKERVVFDAISKRNPLTDDEFHLMLQLAKEESEDLYIMLKVLAYTGMRHSEFFKMTLINEGFDLREKTLKLKTFSSHRLIPKHPELFTIRDEEIFRIQETYSPDILSKLGMQIIRKVTLDKTKVVYSLRHGFATKLSQALVNEVIINELMGHIKGNSMSLKNYASGFGLETLRDAINKISYGEDATEGRK